MSGISYKTDCDGTHNLRIEADMSNAEQRRFLKQLSTGELEIVGCKDTAPGYNANELGALTVLLRKKIAK